MNLKELVEKIDLSRFPIPVDLQVEEYTRVAVLKVVLQVKDRETGVPLRVLTEVPFETDAEYNLRVLHGFSPASLALYTLDRIRNTIIRALTHELDECFLFDGKRLYDPHRKDPHERLAESPSRPPRPPRLVP